MKYLKLLILTILLGTFSGMAQQKGYEIVGDSVVFTFVTDDYNHFIHDANGKKTPAKNISIEEVYLAGEFNDWARQGWKMKRISRNTFQLTKSLREFDNRPDWQFKYIVNSTFWAEPDRSFDNITMSEKSDFWRSVYNLNMHTLAPDPEGNATFTLAGRKDAEQVILSGSFNKWNTEALKMQQTPDGWAVTLKLPPGSYTYKFIVDGNWIHDPGNPEKVYNEYGGYNSLIVITTPVEFELRDHQDAGKVFLAGTFNNWDPTGLPMKRDGDGWKVSINLPGGKHHYKFIVDDTWITDPDNEIQEFDMYGHLNSVIMIK